MAGTRKTTSESAAARGPRCTVSRRPRGVRIQRAKKFPFGVFKRDVGRIETRNNTEATLLKYLTDFSKSSLSRSVSFFLFKSPLGGKKIGFSAILCFRPQTLTHNHETREPGGAVAAAQLSPFP